MMMNALDLLYALETEKGMTEYEKARARDRVLFFKALGIEDDGRYNPKMTDEEFESFGKPIVRAPASLAGKTVVEIAYYQLAYEDVSYKYCFEDDVVYESRFYIGD